MPIATKYGVPASVFWDLNPRRMRSWQILYNEDAQADLESRDNMAWMIGGYVARAIAAAFNGRKSPYPKEPDLAKYARDKAEEKSQHDAMKFGEWAAAFNKSFEVKK